MKKIFFAFALLPTLSFSQSITYLWPGPLGQPVVYPKLTDEHFMATRAEWHGPLTAVSGEGPAVQELKMTGWPCEPGSAYLMMNVLAFEPLVLDSITVIHRHDAHGPKRLLVIMSSTRGVEEHIIADTSIADGYGTTRIALHGLIAPPTGAEYGSVQLKVMPYNGAEGAWDIGALTVHASRPKAKHIERLPTIAAVLNDKLVFDPSTAKGIDVGTER